MQSEESYILSGFFKFARLDNMMEEVIPNTSGKTDAR